MKSDEEAIETILEAVKKAGYEPGLMISELPWMQLLPSGRQEQSERYKLPKAGTVYTSEQLIEHWEETG